MRALACLLVLLASRSVLADEDSHDRARRALEAGEIVRLDEVLAALRARGVGQVLEVELERHDGRWIYEVETLGPDGTLSKHVIDATTKQELPRDGHDEE